MKKLPGMKPLIKTPAPTKLNAPTGKKPRRILRKRGSAFGKVR